MRAALAGLIALPLAAATPDDAPPVWQGSWAGRVGTLPIRACLMRRDAGRAWGAYYYLSRLRPIGLRQEGHGRAWTEDRRPGDPRARPEWRFETVAADRLAGSWSDGGRRLRFRLARVGGADDTCESDAFNAARTRPLRAVPRPAVLSGVAYTKLRFDAGRGFPDAVLESFALAGNDPGTRRINARLRRQMPADASQGAWYACVTGSLSAQGVDGDYAVIVQPTLIAARWLGASEAIEGNCGGAHPFAGATPLTFDRRSGAEVDLHDWLTPAAVEHRDGYPHLRPALRRVIGIRARIQPACTDAVAADDLWLIALTRGGLVFTPSMPHGAKPCEQPTTLGWATLTPWLSPAGRAGLASLRSAAR